MQAVPLKINYPIARLGRIVQSDVMLTDTKSEQTAKAIEQNADLFRQKISEKLQGLGAKILFEAGEDYFRISETPPIISFKEITIDLKGFRISTRLSLTVCNYSRNSKIWSRMTLQELNGGAAFGLDNMAAKSFLVAAEEANREVIKSALDIYESIMCESGTAARLEPRYELALGGFNTDDRRLQLLFQEIENGEFSGVENLISEYDDTLSILFGLCLKQSHIDSASQSQLDRVNEIDISYLPGTAEDSATGALVIGHPDDHCTNVGCISYDTTIDSRSTKPAERATRLLAWELGEAF